MLIDLEIDIGFDSEERLVCLGGVSSAVRVGVDRRFLRAATMADVATLTAALEAEKKSKAEILAKSQKAFKQAKAQIDMLKGKVAEGEGLLQKERAAKEASEVALAQAKMASHLGGSDGGAGGAAAGGVGGAGGAGGAGPDAAA